MLQLAEMLPKLFILQQPMLTRQAADALSALCGSSSSGHTLFSLSPSITAPVNCIHPCIAALLLSMCAHWAYCTDMQNTANAPVQHLRKTLTILQAGIFGLLLKSTCVSMRAERAAFSGRVGMPGKPLARLLTLVLDSDVVWESKDPNVRLSIMQLVEIGLSR